MLDAQEVIARCLNHIHDAPEPAGQRVIAATHRAHVRLADGAARSEVAAGARAATGVYGEPINGEALALEGMEAHSQ